MIPGRKVMSVREDSPEVGPVMAVPQPFCLVTSHVLPWQSRSHTSRHSEWVQYKLEAERNAKKNCFGPRTGHAKLSDVHG